MKTAPRSAQGSANVARRAALVVALWAGFWLLALGLILSLLWISFIQMQTEMQVSGFISFAAALTLAWALRPRMRPKHEAKPRPLTREQAAKLYQMVEEIGKRLGVRAPVEIHLVGGATAFISAKRNWLGQVKHLDVGLGLPLFGNLTEAELGSVIAHEFGHFVGGDLSLGPWIYRTRLALANTVHELDDSMFFLDILFRWYFRWFLRISMQVSRQQEYSADATAARCFGVPATRSALEKIHLIEPLWSSYLDHELSPAINRSVKLPIFAGFKRFCQTGVRRKEVQAAIDWASTYSNEYRATDQFDSHPSLPDRVAALVPGSKPGLPPPAQCFDLLGGQAAIETIWYNSLELNLFRAVEWERFGADILQEQICARFAESWMDPRQLSLTQLPAMLQDLDNLWWRFKSEGASYLSRAGKQKYVLDILEEWVIACLCHSGFVPEVQPGQLLNLRRTKANGSIEQVQAANILAQVRAGALQEADLAALGA